MFEFASQMTLGSTSAMPAPAPTAAHMPCWVRISMMISGKRPLIIAGNGTIRTRASAALRSFCEATGIGVLMTFMAKGALDLEDPRCLFTIGMGQLTIGMGQRDFPMPVVDAADLIITMGYDMVEYPPEKWNPLGDKKIVHLDFIPAEVDSRYIPAVEVVGDLAASITALKAKAATGETEFDFSDQKSLRQKMLEEFAEHCDQSNAGPIKPQKAIADVRACLGPSDLLLCGVGAHKMWIARQYQAYEPGTCIISNGFCSMGMPLPGAISAAISCPGRKVLGLAGDGDFLMNLQEMETASRLKSDITMLVWEDHSYGLIAWKQEQEFGTHTDLSFSNPDWVPLGQSFGWKVDVCDRAANLQSTLRASLDHKGPALVVISVDYSENMKLTERLGQITACL